MPVRLEGADPLGERAVLPRERPEVQALLREMNSRLPLVSAVAAPPLVTEVSPPPPR